MFSGTEKEGSPIEWVCCLGLTFEVMGMFCGPPSLHRSGKIYSWRKDEALLIGCLPNYRNGF